MNNVLKNHTEIVELINPNETLEKPFLNLKELKHIE